MPHSLIDSPTREACVARIVDIKKFHSGEMAKVLLWAQLQSEIGGGYAHTALNKRMGPFTSPRNQFISIKFEMNS